MAIVIHSSTTSSGLGDGSFNYTVPSSATNRYMLLGVGSYNTFNYASGATYASSAMTQLGRIATADNVWIQLFKLLNPVTGTNSVALTFTAGIYWSAGVVAFSGVNQSSSEEYQGVSGSASKPTISLSSTANDLAYGVVVNAELQLAPATADYDAPNSSAGRLISSEYQSVTSSTTVLNWNDTTTWALLGVSIHPSAEPAATKVMLFFED